MVNDVGGSLSASIATNMEPGYEIPDENSEFTGKLSGINSDEKAESCENFLFFPSNHSDLLLERKEKEMDLILIRFATYHLWADVWSTRFTLLKKIIKTPNAEKIRDFECGWLIRANVTSHMRFQCCNRDVWVGGSDSIEQPQEPISNPLNSNPLISRKAEKTRKTDKAGKVNNTDMEGPLMIQNDAMRSDEAVISSEMSLRSKNGFESSIDGKSFKSVQTAKTDKSVKTINTLDTASSLSHEGLIDLVYANKEILMKGNRLGVRDIDSLMTDNTINAIVRSEAGDGGSIVRNNGGVISGDVHGSSCNIHASNNNSRSNLLKSINGANEDLLSLDNASDHPLSSILKTDGNNFDYDGSSDNNNKATESTESTFAGQQSTFKNSVKLARIRAAFDDFLTNENNLFCTPCTTGNATADNQDNTDNPSNTGGGKVSQSSSNNNIKDNHKRDKNKSDNKIKDGLENKKCSYGCGMYVPEWDLINHLTSLCGKRPVVCPECEEGESPSSLILIHCLSTIISHPSISSITSIYHIHHIHPSHPSMTSIHHIRLSHPSITSIYHIHLSHLSHPSISSITSVYLIYLIRL